MSQTLQLGACKVLIQPLFEKLLLIVYYVPSILLAPQNQPALWRDRCHSSDEESSGHSAGARADGGQPGPDSRAGEALLDHPHGDAEVMIA